MIDLVNSHAPNFKASVLGRQIMSPLDLERTFGLIGGDIFHGALSLDQMFSARPMLGHGDYRGPLPGLYMCGSGTHPGVPSRPFVSRRVSAGARWIRSAMRARSAWRCVCRRRWRAS